MSDYDNPPDHFLQALEETVKEQWHRERRTADDMHLGGILDTIRALRVARTELARSQAEAKALREAGEELADALGDVMNAPGGALDEIGRLAIARWNAALSTRAGTPLEPLRCEGCGRYTRRLKDFGHIVGCPHYPPATRAGDGPSLREIAPGVYIDDASTIVFPRAGEAGATCDCDACVGLRSGDCIFTTTAEAGAPCDMCAGSGRNTLMDPETACGFCEGTGRAPVTKGDE